uniref:Putative membrane-associated kinase regulator 2 n=1 Tax=Anthurium amnicola TaxID=1678845 RepID=A0A1D1XUL7_9ARAE
MEAFSLLKYWRGGGGGAATISPAAASATTTTTTRPALSITTIATSVVPSADEETDEEGDDEGPFFDLEFAVPDEDCEGEGNDEDDDDVEGVTDDDEGAAEEDREFNFTVSSEGSCGGGDLRADPGLPLSPSDDLFFKGRLVPLESSSLVFNPSEAHAKPPILPVSLLKTKFRVLMLGFKRPKHALAAAAAGETPTGPVPAAAPAAPSPKHPHQRQSKLFTVKFKVEEVPIVSLFTRDNSSRSSVGSSNGRASKTTQADECSAQAPAGEKKLSKELVHKYLSKIKPLYVRVSKRYAEKLRFSGPLGTEAVVPKEPQPQQQPQAAPPSSGDPSKPEAKGGGEAEVATAPSPAPTTATTKANPKPPQLGNLPAGLRVVCKHLGKSRSASAAVAAVPSPPTTLARRRDDSLLQQQDGIQSAIAHCKMSFNASKDSDQPCLFSSTGEACTESTADPPRPRCDKSKEDCV